MGQKRSSLLTGLINLVAALAGSVGALVGIRRLAARGSESEPAQPEATVDNRRPETRRAPSKDARMADEPRSGTAGTLAEIPRGGEAPQSTGRTAFTSVEATEAPATAGHADEEPLVLASHPPASTPRPALAPLRPGWHRPEHMELPEPTYWPAAMAFAITLLAWSLVTSTLIAVVGLVLFVLALAGWIGDLTHEQH